ncbi:MAG: permease [Mycobacterium leprae]
MSVPPISKPRLKPQQWFGIAFFVAILVVGLYIAKWQPYYHKAILSATNHSIGSSIVTGKAAAAPVVGWAAAWGYFISYFNAIWKAMVVGLLLGAGVQVLVPRQWLLKALGKTSFGTTAAAAVCSVPTMMCTCCAAPVVVGMKRQKVSTGAAVAFWLGNTMLNPATMIFMGFVLGWRWVGLRLAVALALVLGVGQLANRFMKEEDLPESVTAQVAAADTQEQGSLLLRWLKALGEMCVVLVPENIMLVMLLGLARTWLFPAMNPAIGHAWWLVIVLAVTGTLFVIPTAGEIPIVQVLQSYGLGAAGAGVLLTVLPPVSLPSLIMVGRAMERKALYFVAASVMVLGVAAGVAAAVLGF